MNTLDVMKYGHNIDRVILLVPSKELLRCELGPGLQKISLLHKI